MTPTRRGFLFGTVAASISAAGRRAAGLLAGKPLVAVRADETTDAAQLSLTLGPFLGDLTATSVRVWAKCTTPGSYLLTVRGVDGQETFGTTAEATAENDRCVVWQATGLREETRYRYEITFEGQSILGDDDTFFVTPPSRDAATLTRLAVGSCAREDAGTAEVWRRMSGLDPHAVVLLGDTPYIDSTVLDVQRTRYSEFAAVRDFANLLRTKPLYATWDDHDFGANDTDGRLEGKDDARRAFIEYHANPSYGEDDQGVYTKFRWGGVEVFLLDTRYFAGTEPSPVAADQPTLLGRRQWEWLRRELSASTAPFKLLASGMIWNEAVRPGKLDHWGTYPHEREALFRFIGEENISGVVLAGGDIHRTRVLRYDTTETAGYPLTELVTSPMHGGVIDNANTPHPALIHDSGEPHALLLITVDTTLTPATLVAQFQNSAGRELYSVTLTSTTLSAT
jgi:alkaline phosphatase D